MSNAEQVVLVNEQDEVLGTADKVNVHDADTKLHRGVSVFVFNTRKQVLIQKRHSSKKTWANFWSNSFCGHPALNETYEQAALKRGWFELGIKLEKLHFVSNYRYRFTYNNVVENEICPIYFAISNKLAIPHLREISQIKWLSWSDFLYSIENRSEEFTPWCIEEARLLRDSMVLQEYMGQES